MVVSLQLH